MIGRANRISFHPLSIENDGTCCLSCHGQVVANADLQTSQLVADLGFHLTVSEPQWALGIFEEPGYLPLALLRELRVGFFC